MIEYTSKRIVCPHCGHHTRVELDADTLARWVG